MKLSHTIANLALAGSISNVHANTLSSQVDDYINSMRVNESACHIIADTNGY
jgi:outer membrane murein-binding lipoprotein Lpp